MIGSRSLSGGHNTGTRVYTDDVSFLAKLAGIFNQSKNRQCKRTSRTVKRQFKDRTTDMFNGNGLQLKF